MLDTMKMMKKVVKQQANDNDPLTGGYILEGFTNTQLKQVYEFLCSFQAMYDAQQRSETDDT